MTDRYSKLKRVIRQDYCTEHWKLMRNLKNKNTQSAKTRVCKICGETDVNKMARSNVGINYCKKCDRARRQNFIKRFSQDPAYIEKQKLQWKLKMESLTDEEKSMYFQIQSISSKNWHEKLKLENPERHKKLFDKWNNIVRNMSPEERKAYYDKIVSKHKPKTEAELLEWKSKISNAQKSKTDDEKLIIQKKRKDTIKKKTAEEIRKWYKNISRGVNRFQDDHPERLVQMRDQFKVFWAKMKNGSLTPASKAEFLCYSFLKDYYPDVIHHWELDEYIFDFYIPSLDLLVCFEGVYFHGYLILQSAHPLQKFFKYRKQPKGRQIILSMKRDRKKAKKYKNMIRITDIEFKKTPNLVLERINKYKNANGLK